MRSNSTMASLARTESSDEGPNGVCRSLLTCLSCFGVRFDDNSNYFYNIFRSFIFISQTILWVGFVLVFQGAIESTFQYLASGSERVIAYWVSCLVVVVVALVFTHIYMRLNTPEANRDHFLQANGERVLQTMIGRQVPLQTSPRKSKKKQRTNPGDI